jgi:hypothetical protein
MQASQLFLSRVTNRSSTKYEDGVNDSQELDDLSPLINGKTASFSVTPQFKVLDII